MPLNSSIQAALDPPVRPGVISFAHAHVNAYLDVIARASRMPARAAWTTTTRAGVGQRASATLDWVPRLDELLARTDIDAVFITSPTNRHAEHAVLAAHAGKHILLQKPMALVPRRLRPDHSGGTRRAGVLFSMCYQMRADPVNLKMKELLAEGGRERRDSPAEARDPDAAQP